MHPFRYLLGWTTIIEGLDSSSGAILINRRIGRLMQWDLDQASKLPFNLPFTPGDDRPRFLVRKLYSFFSMPFGSGNHWRSADLSVVAINAAIEGLLFAVIWLYLTIDLRLLRLSTIELPYFFALGVGLLGFVLRWFMEMNYTTKYLQ